MPKIISQETFDNVVKENIEEFEMDAEEAMQEAIQQFEAQGVNLANIVKDVNLYTDGGGTHTVVEMINKLDSELSKDSMNKDIVMATLKTIQSECEEDLAKRILAGKNNCYTLLLQTCKKASEDVELLKTTLRCFCALCNGQPDLLDEEGIMWNSDSLKSNQIDSDITALLVRFMRLNCVMHERNRQKYVACDIIAILSSIMDKYKTDSEVLGEVCAAFRILTNDDDIRAAFGKAHEHAKIIVTKENALKKIMDICNDHKDNEKLLGDLYVTLSRLAVRNEFCQEIMDLGGVELMIDTMRNNIQNQSLMRQVLNVVKTIAGNDQVKAVIVESGGIELILCCMQKHQMSSAVSEMGCAALTTLALRNPAHSARIMAADGAEIIAKAMQLHPDKQLLQKSACMAIRNIVARCKEYSTVFVELGVEEYIRHTLKTHPTCNDEAKAALRDLDLNVELKTPWTGEGKGIAS